MKRHSHLDAPPRTLLSRPHSYGGWYRLEEEVEAADLHPLQIVLCCTGGLSLLGIVVNVILQVLLACSDESDPSVGIRLLEGLLLCLGVFGLSLVGLILFNKLRRLGS